MANWDTVRVNVGRAASKAIKKTGEVADITALYIKLKTAEARLSGYYTALGKLTYKQLKTGESQAEKIAPVVEQIDEVKLKITVLTKKIAAEREKRKKSETEIIIETSVEQMNAEQTKEFD